MDKKSLALSKVDYERDVAWEDAMQYGGSDCDIMMLEELMDMINMDKLSDEDLDKIIGSEPADSLSVMTDIYESYENDGYDM